MSIKCKYVEATIADTQSSVVTTAFLPVSSLSKAFLLPATSNQHCGLGDALQANARHYYTTADLTAVDSITFQRGGTSGACPCACWIVEFEGQPGDADEFVMRGKTTTTFALATDLTVASSAIAGIVDPAKCVPFMHVRFSNASTNNTGGVQAIGQMDLSGPDDVNSFTRLTGSGQPTMIVYNVEFLGQTSVQTGDLTASVTNADRNTTITSVTNISQAFVYTQLMSQHAANDLTYYAWLTSATNLRTRILDAGSIETLRYWVLSNPSWDVQHVSAVNGTTDWADTTDPQTETVAITAVDRKRSLVIGHAGAATDLAADHPAGTWRFKLSTDTEVEAHRVKSVGASEYAFMVVEFSRGLPPAGRKPQQNTLLRM